MSVKMEMCVMRMLTARTLSAATCAPVSLVTPATEPVAMTLTSVSAVLVTPTPPVSIATGVSPVSARVNIWEMDSTAHVSPLDMLYTYVQWSSSMRTLLK